MSDTDGDTINGEFWVCPWCGALFLSSEMRREHMQEPCPQKPEDD